METGIGTPRKRHVLIVDDDAELAWFFKKLLELHGYDVDVVSDGVQALEHVLYHEIAAVICDLQMPKLEGDLLYVTVERSNPSLARRFIFVTGFANDPRFRTFVSTVDVPVLEKPVLAEKLLEALNGVVGSAKS